MNPGSTEEPPARVETFLSGAYRRILWITMALGLAGSLVAAVFFGWRNGLGTAAGALLGVVNFVWLHHAAAMMTERMLPSVANAPSKLRLVMGFAGRYIFVLAAAYVILKSWPQVLVGFIVALFFPLVAATCEGIYEALASGKTDPSAN